MKNNMTEAGYQKKCRKLIKDLEGKVYFAAAVNAYRQRLAEIENAWIADGASVREAEKQAAKEILSHLHDVMRSAQPLVENLINKRIASGAIANAEQARKSAAGNIFQQMFAYSLAENVLCGNITVPVVITTSISKIIEQYAAITVGNDIQKPDSDVIVYSEEDEDSPILNFSCKTSCRERAGQTYKWKLLCDLAVCRCEHKEGNAACPATKYRLAYTPKKDIKMCFVTADFYNELRNPQINAMFHFFDYSYVARTVSPAPHIKVLKTVIDDINHILKLRT